MKKMFLVASCATLLFACGGNANQQAPAADSLQTAPTENAAVTASFYGEKITEDSAVAVSELAALMGDKAEMPIKITGEITDVCQKKGCWMEIKNAAGAPLRVTFKDYGFFMPKDAAGKTAIMAGIAKVEVTSIADLKEYAKDAGDDKAAIDAIKEPKKELVFEANGVILK
ncbi:MAG: DUF4920 domain-containing protein [Sphingobacteriales bacterium]|jgi:hypothetical protein|nr:DUF4920 domain-containing protein [Sphingobacteriales bacterium]